MATSPATVGQWYDDYVKTAPKTAAYVPAKADTTQWNVDDNQTVQGQVAKITQSGSPLMQQAQTKALQGANARGMLNSSMAIGAAQGAVYDAALPIAQQDANTQAQRGQFNAGQANQTSQFNAGAENQAGQFNAGEANATDRARYQTAADLAKQDKTQAFQTGEREAGQAFDMTRLDAQQQNTLQVIKQQFKDNVAMTELQNKLSNENLPRQYAANYSQQMLTQVGAILADPNLDATAKRNAVQNAIDFANSSLSWVGTMYGTAFPNMQVPGATAPPGSTGPQPATAGTTGPTGMMGAVADIVRKPLPATVPASPSVNNGRYVVKP